MGLGSVEMQLDLGKPLGSPGRLPLAQPASIRQRVSVGA